MSRRCGHLPPPGVQTVGYSYRVTGGRENVDKELCWNCYQVFLQSVNADPDLTIGYHIYRTTNPDAPKDQWERLTTSPIPIEQFVDTTREPGVDYYYFNTPVNAYDEEGSPEPAWDARGRSLGTLDDREM